MILESFHDLVSQTNHDLSYNGKRRVCRQKHQRGSERHRHDSVQQKSLESKTSMQVRSLYRQEATA